jgi:hypothetical protein
VEAEGDMTSAPLATSALEKAAAGEETIVILTQRKGKKIASVIWQRGYFQQASLVDHWATQTKGLSKYFCLYYILK